jgi:lipopolysaccharide/colanic/teichoic acid biosynthesis glycosyltransferase
MLTRVFDFTVALLGLTVLLPLLSLVAVVIKLDSDGPVFFRQERVGLNGKHFRIFKFRTMVEGAYKMGSRLTVKRDPRITGVGQVLRWFKIDELPQLLNVLLGDMALIGPRPEDPHFVAFYSAEQRQVLSVRPGIVGPSQIHGRDELEQYPEGLKDTEAYYVQYILPQKLERDLEYVRARSFRGDMVLLARGLGATVLGAVKGKFLWRRRRRIALFLLDAVLIVCSHTLAYLIRMDFRWPMRTYFLLVPLACVLIVRLIALTYFGSHQGLLAYFGLWDVIALFKAVTLSALIAAGLTFFLGLQAYPRSVFVIDWALALFILVALRYGRHKSLTQKARRGRHGVRREKALVAGAGHAGEQIARVLLEDPLSPYRPVGFIDEVSDRWGALIHGIRVLGGIGELPLALSANGVKVVFVCPSDLDDRTTRKVVEICEKQDMEYRIVPALRDLLSTDAFRANGNEGVEGKRKVPDGLSGTREGVLQDG